jgi:hypothetical protein
MPYGWVPPPPPPPKSSSGKVFVLGCLGVFVVLCLGAGIAAALLGKAVLRGVGQEIATVPVVVGQPFRLAYVQRGSGEVAVWLDIEASYGRSLQLTGPLAVRVNGTPIQQHALALGDGSCQAIEGGRTSVCIGWNNRWNNGVGTVTGKTRLFTVPAQPRGAMVTVTGMAFAGPGVTVHRARLFAAE